MCRDTFKFLGRIAKMYVSFLATRKIVFARAFAPKYPLENLAFFEKAEATYRIIALRK